MPGIGRPSDDAGGSMPSRRATVGATSIMRTAPERAPRGTPRPSAKKIPPMSGVSGA